MIGEFQFHKGTIKTRGRRGADFAMDSFQFHKGTIKTQSQKADFIAENISIP